MAGVTIEQVKKNKIELESAITKLLQDFEKTNNVQCRYFNIERKRTDCSCERPMPCGCVEASNSKPGPIINVSMEVELDLIY